jgi:hypothetical protein
MNILKLQRSMSFIGIRCKLSSFVINSTELLVNEIILKVLILEQKVHLKITCN